MNMQQPERRQQRLGAITPAPLRRHRLQLRCLPTGMPTASAVKIPSGPSSRLARTPSASSRRTPSTNRTGLRTWRTQYSALQSSSLVARRPVTLLTIGRRGVPNATCDSTLRNASSIGSIRLRMERVAHLQTTGPAPLALELLRQRQNRCFITRDHRRARPVQPRNLHALSEQRQHFRFARLQRHHGAAFGQRLHQAATRRHHTAGIPQRPHARDMRGRELADGMAQQDVGLDAPLLQLTEQRHLHRKQGRLRIGRLVQLCRRLRALPPQTSRREAADPAARRNGRRLPRTPRGTPRRSPAAPGPCRAAARPAR